VQTEINLPSACDAGRSPVQGVPPQRAATVGWREVKTPTSKLSGLQTHEGGDAEKKSQRTPRTTSGRDFSSNLRTPGMSFEATLRGKTEERQQPQQH
jgi:hypothetical protein